MKTKHPFLILLLLRLSLTLTTAAEKPNVLLIVADDLRDYGGVFTRSLVKTPNLDRLRGRGVTFERAYVQYPVCNPSRSSLLTGLRCEQTGVVTNTTLLRERLPDIVTLPQLCKEQGWHAAAFGKIFHLNGGRNSDERAKWVDLGKSWNEADNPETTPAGQKLSEGRNLSGGALGWCSWGAAEGSDDDQPDGQIARATVSAIEQLTQRGTPWFLGCGFHKPHDPFIAPKKYFDLYPLESLPLWRDPADTTPAPPSAVGFGGLGDAFRKFTDAERREFLRAYCAGTSFMDAQLGRVLDALDAGSLWEKTIVIFIGDHGYHTGERAWWNKNTLFERSCRAPLIIAAPGAKRGAICRSLVEFVDLYPTVADLCGLTPPHALAGKSLGPLLTNPDASVKDAAFTLVTRGANFGRSIRTERWRFTEWSSSELELYDHASDPEETHNLAAQPTHRALIAEMKKRFATLPPWPKSP
jgi:uncharacterized sulfatase